MVWFGIPALLLVLSVLGVTLARQLSARRRDARWRAVQPFRLSRRAVLEDLAVLGGRVPDATIDRARESVLDAADEDAVREVLTALRAARPDLDPPCALDPGHGAGGHRVDDHAVCDACATSPRPRLVRRGDRLIPWLAAGPAYDAYAHGWFDDALDPIRERAADLLAWEQGPGAGDDKAQEVWGAGWYGVLLAANHRMGRYSSG